MQILYVSSRGNARNELNLTLSATMLSLNYKMNKRETEIVRTRNISSRSCEYIQYFFLEIYFQHILYYIDSIISFTTSET